MTCGVEKHGGKKKKKKRLKRGEENIVWRFKGAGAEEKWRTSAEDGVSLLLHGCRTHAILPTVGAHSATDHG